MRKWLAIWLVSLVAVAGFASVFTRAQSAQPGVTILSGNDLGFRVDGNREGRAIGTLMVRINGQWVETAASLEPRRLVTN